MRQSKRVLLAAVLASAAAVAAVAANADSNIVRWVDNQGMTHFGNQQFAPPGNHEAVKVDPANGMVAPRVPKQNRTAVSGPNIVTLDRSKLKNKRGFRGYASRPSASQSPRRRR